ncbi:MULTISPECIES: hypothetical protein [unclassified Pseudomonas]|jgi:hypothetical protein|uniref:hypothetical protein n=1 Tax=unclassified Pseudomonas TaxID=196821 RepID=UPI000C81C390|nr:MULTISPECIES: hypothetical protein [unclassified Pseudomonas]MDX9673361.1 hypothetical protein [Pseudomonas sp. P8_250]PMQ14049.1 hypothetical protein PseAD21_01580 [Pseudomonas sp. AD21]WPN38103.1 hypothetical protein QMK53_10750 [Pseudomonas sp. P8_139]WPN40094.1 hypothetical protein QMK55_20625 [Pseudomonas sp. P8_229]
MNSTLLLANAIALAALVGFHFVPEGAEPVAQRMPHYLQVQKAPQWAVLSDHSDFAAQTASTPEQTLSARATERLVF